MREIKFRGHNGSKWLHSTEISGIPCFNEVHYFMPNQENVLSQEYLGNWDSVSYVGQYTGLKDKSEKEIYEGDIIKVISKHWNNCGKEYIEKITEEIGEVTFFKNWEVALKIKEKDGTLYRPFLWIFGEDEDYEIEILGNIYENKDLI